MPQVFRGRKSAFVADFVNFAKNNALKSVELLAPAKDLQSAVAAVDYGADAVYIGAPKFGARAAAGNTLDDIRQLCDYAHLYSARIYVDLNTILKEEELAEAEQMIWQLYEAGADALIVQDMGITQLNLRLSPCTPVRKRITVRRRR